MLCEFISQNMKKDHTFIHYNGAFHTDRKEGIRTACMLAQKGDIVLVAGKGHESGQVVGDTVLPFDDVEQASVAVAALEGRI